MFVLFLLFFHIFIGLQSCHRCSELKRQKPNSDEDSDADEITDYLNINANETKHEPVSLSLSSSTTTTASSTQQPIYSSTLGGTERDLNHSSSSCSSSSTNSAHNSHIVGRKKTYATLGSNTVKMVMNSAMYQKMLNNTVFFM